MWRGHVVSGRAIRLAAAISTSVLFTAGGWATRATASLAFHEQLQSASAAPRFEPRSMTFPSASVGWVLGTVRCRQGGTCFALRETKDAGRSWVSRPFPSALAAAIRRAPAGAQAQFEDEGPLSVHFADANDGWIYGALGSHPLLWSTHDGGRIWRQQPPRTLTARGEGAILDVASAAGTARLMVSIIPKGVSVESSPVGVDRWRISSSPHLGFPAGGSQLVGAFVLSGGEGWLVVGNDRGTTGSARLNGGGQWVRWTPPCAAVGDGFAVPAAPTPRTLFAVCVMGGYASALSSAAPPGATLGSSWLYLSTNGGQTFTPGPELGPLGIYFGEIVSPSAGVLLLTRSGAHGEDLIESSDGGVNWTVVYRGAVGAPSFATTKRGYALAGSTSGAIKLIATDDGGQHWVPVRF
jgi:hypothetical protein